MSNPRKSVPIRQLSLSADTSQRRKCLKKQFSEDVPDSKEKWIPELGFHVSLCTKSQIKTLDRPPPAKQAWIENRHEDSPNETNNKTEEGIIAKKCKETKRPVTAKIIRQSSLNNKDSILLSHQELAERLRQAWKDREKGKQNLNIFLAHNIKEKQEDEFNNDLTDSEGTFSNETNAYDKIVNKPKIILPLKPETLVNNEINYKNIFQKRIRRTHSVDEPLRDIAYSPTRAFEAKSRAVVVVPLVDSTKGKENAPSTAKLEPENIIVPKIHQQPTYIKEDEKPLRTEQNQNIERKNSLAEESKPIDVIIRPMTANAKREGFRSRTNSAFNGTNGSITKENYRPPLVRASSVPLKPAPSKPKFISVKRRIKSAPKRKEKSDKPPETDERFVEDNEGGKSKNKKFQRCVSVSGAEVITMVSLVSPEDSETEEHIEAEKEKLKPKTGSPTKTSSVEKNEKLEQQKTFTLRKAVKSVSFQQSSIHAVRSFSASFPARRGSVATALMLSNTGLGKSTNGNHTTQEKRGTLENASDEAREPKRRLLRTKSAPSECSFDDKDDEATPVESKPNESSTSVTSNQSAQPKDAHLFKNTSRPSSAQTKTTTNEQQNENSNSEGNTNAEPTFETPKEKQCWDMYCKMSGKGVNISFDTILRGMLTPTEYRLRRNSLAAAEAENAESNTDNIADS